MNCNLHVVTGCNGFIGTNLVQILMVNPANIIIGIDRKEETKPNSFYPGNYTFNQVDICSKSELFNNMNYCTDQGSKVNIIGKYFWNLACDASPPRYQADPIHTLNTNYIGVRNCLDFCRFHNFKFLQTSTSEIYGNPLQHPQQEDYWGNVNPIGVRSCYDEGKRIAETLIEEYRKQYGVDTKIVRIFNTYGPFMDKDDGRVVSNFINQALNDEDITVYGDGTQTRSLCFIDDLLDGFFAIMESDFHGPINLGNDKEITINNLAKIIIYLCNSKSKIIYKELPKDDPVKRKPNLFLAKRKLEYNPTVSLTDGLTNTINYFKEISC